MKRFDNVYMARAEKLSSLIRSVGNVRDFMAILETAMGSVVDPALFEDNGVKVDMLSEDAYLVSGMLTELNTTLDNEGLEHSREFTND